MQASYNPIFDPQGKSLKFVKFAFDITEQKQAEENLKSLISEVGDVISGMQEGNLTL